MIVHFPVASRLAAVNTAAALNVAWRLVPRPAPRRGSRAPEPPDDVIAVAVQRDDDTWAVLVYVEHRDWCAAALGRLASAPPVRHITHEGISVFDHWGAKAVVIDGVTVQQ